MNEIFFFILAFLTVFLSIKLSYLADNLSNNTKVNKALVGGILLAGITALPELVTCIWAVILKNPHLAFGDVLGSNLFNIFVICFFDIIFLKKMMFSRINNKAFFIFLFLIVNYIFIGMYVSKLIVLNVFNIGIPTFIIIGLYVLYLKLLKKEEINKENDINRIDKVVVKLIITAVCLVLCSSLLTIVVNNIATFYPHFSSSIIGAILLGITTSLPEVITFYTLVSINSYDLALLNIVGSNLFNLLVLAFGDLILRSSVIYDYSDVDIVVMLSMGIVITAITLLQNYRKKSINKFRYIIPSFVVVIIYVLFWFVSFVY